MWIIILIMQLQDARVPLGLIYLISTADLYALSRYIASRSKEQDNHELASQVDESQLTLAQLQHQLAPSEPGALMHLIEEAETVDEADEETKECRSLFKDTKFFLGREVIFLILNLVNFL